MIPYHQLHTAPVRAADAVPTQQRLIEERRARLERMRLAATRIPVKQATGRPLSPFHPARLSAAQIAAEAASAERVAKQCEEVAKTMAKVAPWRQILNEVAERHSVGVSDILSKSRTRAISQARQECCFRLSMELDMALLAVGRRLGVDHTTVLYAIRAHLQRHPELRPTYADHVGEKQNAKLSLYREVIQMYFDDNRMVPEIMRELGIDRNMVNSFIRSEVRKVRQQHTGAPG